MFELLSHILGVIILGVASFLDLRDGEVPDYVFMVGIAGGLFLHRFNGFLIGSFDALFWSLALGCSFFVIGWLGYLYGVWGGADALAFSALGFLAPRNLDGSLHSIDLVLNLMLVILFYSVIFVVWKALRSDGFFELFWKDLVSSKLQIGLEVFFVFGFSLFLYFIGVTPYIHMSLLLFVLFLFRFLSSAEEEVFTKSVNVNELDGGEVLAKEYLDGRIRGVSEEELEDLDVDTVEVRDGVRLVPVFLFTLIITDLNLLGMELFLVIAS